jgi:hypothetical protein
MFRQLQRGHYKAVQNCNVQHPSSGWVNAEVNRAAIADTVNLQRQADHLIQNGSDA